MSIPNREHRRRGAHRGRTRPRRVARVSKTRYDAVGPRNEPFGVAVKWMLLCEPVPRGTVYDRAPIVVERSAILGFVMRSKNMTRVLSGGREATDAPKGSLARDAHGDVPPDALVRSIDWVTREAVFWLASQTGPGRLPTSRSSQ